jgi:hypothetical protein
MWFISLLFICCWHFKLNCMLQVCSARHEAANLVFASQTSGVKVHIGVSRLCFCMRSWNKNEAHHCHRCCLPPSPPRLPSAFLRGLQTRGYCFWINANYLGTITTPLRAPRLCCNWNKNRSAASWITGSKQISHSSPISYLSWHIFPCEQHWKIWEFDSST